MIMKELSVDNADVINPIDVDIDDVTFNVVKLTDG